MRDLGILGLGYLLGAIPFGLLIGKLKQGIDVRQFGSKRTGATNVMRVLGPRWGVIVFLLDFFKGAGGVVIGRVLGGGTWGEALGALSAIIGHIVPVYVGFRGGRGVATGMGGVMAMFPLAFLFGCLVWLIVVKLTRYVSLGSILAGVVSTIVMALSLAFGEVETPAFLYTLASALIIIVSHHDNIRRLLSGTENKIGQRVQTH